MTHTRLINKRLIRVLAILASTVILQVYELPSAAWRGPVDSAGDALRRGEELRRKWNIDAAEEAFREAAALEPASLEAAVGLARVARAKLEYAKALSALDGTKDQGRTSTGVLNEYGAVYLAAEEPAKAREFFESALRISPSDPQATVGLSGADLLERDYEGAIRRLRECVARDPQNGVARAMLARVLLEIRRESDAAEEAQRAIALDACNVEAIYVLAYVRSIERKPNESRTLARRVVSLDQFHFGARRMLSQYLDGQTGYQQNVAEQARLHYTRGRSLKENGELFEAAKELEAALRLEPRYYSALIALADIWLRQGEFQRASETAKLAASVDPDGAIAQFELSCAHRAMNERARIEIGATDFDALFNARRAPAAYATTREIFPNYRFLTKKQQAVIDFSVGPLASYLPKLARRKARHYLLSFDQRPGDIPGFADLAGEKTFDGRYYASLRGVGGRVAVSGVEYLDQAAFGGFNTIAHEFAHQVHIEALEASEVKEIRRLYERARREGRVLDYYAAGNEDEYFAQGYEAFISERKRPGAGVTGGHTRDELLKRDPELYKFLMKLMGKQQAKSGEQGY